METAIKTLFVVLISVTALASASQAKIVYVSMNAPGPQHDGASWATAFTTIQRGVDAAASGDEVWVATSPPTAEAYIENISLHDDVALYGGFAGTEIERAQRDWKLNATVLDGKQTGSVVAVPSTTTKSVTLDGFTIRNGKAEWGGGVSVATGSVRLANNTITDNTGIANAGGVYVASGETTIVNTCIVDNVGGGIDVVNGTVRLVNDTIAGNTGHGVALGTGAAGAIENTIVAFNGTGIDTSGSAGLTVRHTDVYGNTTANYTGMTDPTGSDGNISLDPLFVRGVGGNYRLQTGSPCIDAGDDTVVVPGDLDLGGKPRILGAHVEIGAYEYDPAAPPVTMTDVVRCLSIAGGRVPALPGDLARLNVTGGDQTINLADAVALARRMMALVQSVVPADGQVFTTDTILAPGTYHLRNGVRIGASGITLDLNGATLVGADFRGFGVTCLGYDNAVIRNGRIRGYYYGVRVENGSGIQVLGSDLSDNWVDPASKTPNPPFLNINAPPNLSDRTNLGGGLFMRNVAQALVSDNVMRNSENGIDLYSVTDSTVQHNNASDNTGWGIHLYASTGNLIHGNVADRCIRPHLADSAGFLLVMGSSDNRILDNSFQYGGDGFFIGNEHGCPSNNNLVQGNNGSHAGANAFEATFSSGNRFIDNIADASNYGFWLGYSHTGNVIRGNRIRRNNVNGIEIEHGQHNAIEDNVITGNGGSGIVLRTDGLPHIPPRTGCLNLPDPAASRHYTIRNNRMYGNYGPALVMTATTDSLIVNNLFGGPYAGTAQSDGARNVWSVAPTPGTNIVGGPTLGGNWWSSYTGSDTNGDGLGDTDLPYTNGGQMAAPGDPHPLIGSPDLNDPSNPQTLTDWTWRDLGRNTRDTGETFDTANGAHFATNGTDLYLVEGCNSPRLSQFDPSTNRYVPRAEAPEGVADGSDFQYGGGLYFATVGVWFDETTGEGDASHLIAYDPATNAWLSKSPTTVAGQVVGNEALAYDPTRNRLYTTIVRVKDASHGGDPTLLRKLAVYDVAQDRWVGATSTSPEVWNAGTEAEYLDGRIYVYRGAGTGRAVNGEDSYLNVYDIATDTWSRTPSLLDAGVAPGFLTGSLDGWGVSMSVDPVRKRLFVTGGESNRLLYVYEVPTRKWAVGPTAPYDGGWGSSIEYVASSQRLYQIDGRNARETPQGTACLAPLSSR